MRKLSFLFLLLLPIHPALAWGPVGHETVAYIAWDNLSQNALFNVIQLESPLVRSDPFNRLPWNQASFARLSNWADEIRDNGRRETGPWHYIDLPIRKNITVEDEEDYCRNGDCIIDQLQNFEKILGDSSQPQEKRLEALKFVVHFIGDLHMPLHCADDGDKGGNEKLVNFNGSVIKLHRLWDGLLEIRTQEDPRTLATRLEKGITDKDRKEWTELPETTMEKINKIGEGNPLVDTAGQITGYTTETKSITFNPPVLIPTKIPGVDQKTIERLNTQTQLWAFESYQIAKTVIYKGMYYGPRNYADNPLPSDYYDKMRPIVDEQLEKAGIRLAYVLNEIFK